MSQKVIFMGTPAFSVPPLKALIAAGYDIVAVYSQPPRPANRGKKLQKSDVHAYADEQGIPVHTPTKMTTEEIEKLASYGADYFVVVAYGMILPKAALEIPKKYPVNIHASLLPRWRGAAPIHRAIEAGDKKTGITTMKMDEGLDTGDILLVDEVPITSKMTTGELHDILAEMGAKLIVETLKNDPKSCPQPSEGITYAKKIKKEEAKIDWTLDAEVLARKVCAFNPYPACYFELNGQRIKVLEAEFTTASGEAGEVLDNNILIGCGEGSLLLKKLQRQGKSAMSKEDFLRGFPIEKGMKLS